MNDFFELRNISKQFGSIFANHNINLTIQKGEVHTLLGENGAGKSTLMNILIGLYQPTNGELYLQGKPIKIDSPKTAVQYGIGMVHQHFMLVEAMTVFENIILGSSKDHSIFIKQDTRKKEILELSRHYELDIDLDKQITEISVGAQQRVEILKALYRGADLLILDEPTAALTDIEVQGLFKIIKKLTSENKSVIFISHKMREVMEISDRVTILRNGESIQTLKITETTETELANLMIGRDMVPSIYKKVSPKSENVLAFTDVSYKKQSKHNGLNEITMHVKKGEIVGIAGVDGNGQSQLAQIAAGDLIPEEGKVLLKGKTVSHYTPNDFLASHVSHIPEDRNKMGLIGNMSVTENLVLKETKNPAFSKFHGWYLKKKAMNEYAEKKREENDIRCSGISQEARNLSGGNQQKIILARELSNDPDLLVAVHPTRGLDIGASEFVHNSMVSARDRGCGILLISADFDEVLKLSDRILVMFEGKIMGEYSGIHPPIKEISLAMSGKSKQEVTSK